MWNTLLLALWCGTTMGEEHEAKVVGMQCKGRDVVTGWDSLSSDLLENIFLRLHYEDLFRCKAVSKACKDSIESDSFGQSRGDGQEGSFRAINYTIENNIWRRCGYDVESSSWRSLPTYSSCPRARVSSRSSLFPATAASCELITRSCPRRASLRCSTL